MSFSKLLLLIVFIIGCVYVYFRYYQTPNNGENPIYTLPAGSPIQAYSGTIKKGSDIPEKSFCAEGYYLVANPGQYLMNQTSMLLLNNMSDDGGSTYDASEYDGEEVQVRAIYPDNQVRCEALTCSCEDFLMVDTIEK